MLNLNQSETLVKIAMSANFMGLIRLLVIIICIKSKKWSTS